MVIWERQFKKISMAFLTPFWLPLKKSPWHQKGTAPTPVLLLDLLPAKVKQMEAVEWVVFHPRVSLRWQRRKCHQWLHIFRRYINLHSTGILHGRCVSFREWSIPWDVFSLSNSGLGCFLVCDDLWCGKSCNGSAYNLQLKAKDLVWLHSKMGKCWFNRRKYIHKMDPTAWTPSGSRHGPTRTQVAVSDWVPSTSQK